MAKRAKTRIRYINRPGPVEVAEPVKSGFTLGNLVNLGGIPLITAVITISGFYYVTNYKLETQDAAIKALSTKLEAAGKSLTDKSADDTAQRDKIRDTFLASQIKTTEGIAKLDTRLAVAEKQQETTNATLTKISETLSKISTFSNKR
jgi:hypothetical protein